MHTNQGHACPILEFSIDNKKFSWGEQYIKGVQLKKLIGTSEPHMFLAIADTWDDEVIADDTVVDLARPGIEHFYTGKVPRVKTVQIEVNHKSFSITKGKHTAAEIKKLDHQPENYELAQKIDGKFQPIDDHAVIDIKGCEVFVCHIKDGSSS